MMSDLLAKVELLPLRRFEDERGWFLKFITGKEANLPAHTGEVYVTLSHPNEIRGNHYHPLANEWFSVLMGECEIVLSDPATDKRRLFTLSEQHPATLYIPSGVGHAFRNSGAGSMMFGMYADRLYDPADTVPLELL